MTKEKLLEMVLKSKDGEHNGVAWLKCVDEGMVDYKISPHAAAGDYDKDAYWVDTPEEVAEVLSHAPAAT